MSKEIYNFQPYSLHFKQMFDVSHTSMHKYVSLVVVICTTKHVFLFMFKYLL